MRTACVLLPTFSRTCAKCAPNTVAVVDSASGTGITYGALEVMTRVVGGELAKQVGGGKALPRVVAVVMYKSWRQTVAALATGWVSTSRSGDWRVVQTCSRPAAWS